MVPSGIELGSCFTLHLLTALIFLRRTGVILVGRQNSIPGGGIFLTRYFIEPLLLVPFTIVSFIAPLESACLGVHDLSWPMDTE